MGKPPMSSEQAASYLASRSASNGNELGTWQGYAIEHAARVIGEVGLYLQANGTEADLGFALHPDFQGHGLATEAAVALTGHGFEGLGLKKITGHCDADNLKSAAVLKRVGMRKEDDSTYYLLHDEWIVAAEVR